MHSIVESGKALEEASGDLEKAVRDHGFGVLHVHNLGDTLRSKGSNFAEERRVFEVCHPAQAGSVLSADMRLNMALPCRISVFTEKGRTKLGMIRPLEMLSALLQDQGLQVTARDVQEKTIAMNEQAKQVWGV